MTHSIQQRFANDVSQALQSSIDDVDEEKLEDVVSELIEHSTDVTDPEQGRVYQMSGRVMDAERKEPITVTLDSPTIAELTSIIGPAVMSAGSLAAGTQDWVPIGFALLSVFSAVRDGRVTEVEPDVAMTYAIGWDMSDAGENRVPQNELEARVIEESKKHNQKEEMDEKDLEDAIWRLKQMGCISGKSRLKFMEGCTVKYK